MRANKVYPCSRKIYNIQKPLRQDKQKQAAANEDPED